MSEICNIFVAGANSLIAQETVREFSQNKRCRFFLVGRNGDKLASFAKDLQARGAEEVITEQGDLVDSAFHRQLTEKLRDRWDVVDIALLAWGELGDAKKAQIDFEEAKRILVVNLTSAISLLTLLGELFVSQKKGTIAVLSSIAGDRGRKTNYVYGCSKAGLSTYLEGMRGRLFEEGVSVVTIKPGPVSTPMTAHLKRTALTADAGPVGRTIYKGICRKQANVYAPWFWRWIMLVIRLLPDLVAKRLSF